MTRAQSPSDSPLFQESLRDDPFWMVVGCLLVNRATWARAAPVYRHLRACWPAPAALASAPLETLREVLTPLGFTATRAPRLRAFAEAWVRFGPPPYAEDLLERPGCGMYAVDTWAIFVEGRRDTCPTDRRLRRYLARQPTVDA